MTGYGLTRGLKRDLTSVVVNIAIFVGKWGVYMFNLVKGKIINKQGGGGPLNPLKTFVARFDAKFDARFDVIYGKYSNNCGKMVNLAKGKMIKKVINFQSTKNCKTPRKRSDFNLKNVFKKMKSNENHLQL